MDSSLIKTMKINYHKLPTKGNFLYVVRWADSPQFVKIGMTTNLANRLRAYRTSYPSELELVALREFDTEIELRHEEEALLAMTRHCAIRRRSEWRRVNDEAMAWIKRRVGTEAKAGELLEGPAKPRKKREGPAFDQNIKECIDYGMTPAEVARTLGCRVARVYRVIL